MDVIRELRRQGHALTLLAKNARNYERYAPPLQELGVNIVADDPDRMKHIGEDRKTSWELREVLERGQFHVAILCHWFWSGISVCEDYLNEIRRFAPETRIVVLSDDRHGERERRMAALSGSFGDWERGNDFEAREMEAYEQADLVLFITEKDRQHFRELLPNLQTELLPMQAEVGAEGPGYAERCGVLFLGNFENQANHDALQWILEEIWPRVLREEPELQLCVAGNGAPKEIEARHRNVECAGRVEDLAPLFAAKRVFAAPIRYGTGINTKNLQALAQGVPLVTTSVGAEGIGLENEEHALVADDAKEFAAGVVRLNRDAALWEKLARAGREMIAAHFSREHLASQIRRILLRTESLAAKKGGQEHAWSFRKVERTNPEVLTQRPATYRTMLRLAAYWQAGHRLLADGRPEEALATFRHAFCLQRGATPATSLHVRLTRDMAEAYRRGADRSALAKCEAEALRLERAANAVLPERAHSKRDKRGHRVRPSDTFELSVVIPTHNRKETLRLCLCALAFQFLPTRRWEIVVVDDGSTDGTEEFCRSYQHPNPNLRFVRQKNQGAGAARRAGVEAARGELVLLMNDDTIAEPNLLAQHLALHRQHSQEKWAVLGAFRPSQDSAQRALSLWINHSAFLFPQNNLKAGPLEGSAHFITCNLSVRRSAILEAGNFDPAFRVGEDTEMGARLEQRGFRAYFHPEAVATHEHAQFTLADLVRRAKAYGAADWLLFQKHRHLLGNGSGPFGSLREADIAGMKAHVEKDREAVAVAMQGLEKMEQLDMAPLLQRRGDESSPLNQLWRQLNTIVPMVYWHYLFESFLAARESALVDKRAAQNGAPQMATVR